MKTELCEIAEKYGTDKSFFYTSYYHELFKDRRESVKRVLELGIGSPDIMLDSVSRVGSTKYVAGASLYMWQDYFPNAEIHALDHRTDLLINKDRITSRWFDQAKAFTYPVFPLSHFGIIIEDGSHEVLDQLTAMRVLVPHLAPGGIYITEDIKPDSIPYIFDLIPYKYEHKHFANRIGTADIVVIRNE